jgi:outer membrane protein TolC
MVLMFRKRSVFWALACLMAVLPAEKTNRISWTLPEFLARMRSASPEVLLARFEMTNALANYHELRDAYAPSLAAGASAGNPPHPLFTVSNLGFAVGASKFFPETGTFLSLNWTNGWAYQSEGTPTSLPISFNMEQKGQYVLSSGTNFFGVVPYTTNIGFNTNFSMSTMPMQNIWNTALTFTVSQSLLRGAPWASPGADALEVLRQVVRVHRSVYNSRIAGLLMAAMQTYLSLDLNRKFLRLADDSIADAKDLLEKNRRRVELGTIDISDVYRAEVNLTFQQNDRDRLIQEMTGYRAQLLYLAGLSELDPREQLIEQTDPLTFRDESFDADALLDLAYKNRKELEQARLQTELARVDLHSAKSSMLPKLDAYATVSVAGFDTNGSYERARANFGASSSNIGWYVGLRLEAPLDPAAYRTTLGKRSAAYAKARETEENLKKQFKVTLHIHLAKLRQYRDVLERTKEALDISDRKVAELKRQFANARITSMQYLMGYEELRNVQRTYYGTLMQWEMQKAALRMDLGVLLKSYGLAEADPGARVR